jgi:hypothetical protein
MSIRTLGIENDKTLYIFDVFQIDKNLKKWKEKKPPKGKIAAQKLPNGEVVVPVDYIDEYEDPENFALSEASRIFIGRSAGNLVSWNNVPDGVFKKLWRYISSLFKEAKAEKVEDTFAKILMTFNEVKEFHDKNSEIDKLIANAIALGQTTLVEELKKNKSSKSFENVLFAKNRKRYITESQLLEFGKKCEKGLCLDHIKDFTRVIPESVLIEKLACDEDMLFDNYVILHYDPDNKATTEKARKKEEVKRKDPILFGIVQNSRNLYFVADWKDELCNLTLQDIIDQTGFDLEIK